jgi:GMP synthase (glutamine-hydrolysing)
MTRARRLVVLKAGDTLPAVKAAHGDFDAMFRRALEASGLELRVVEAARGEPLPAIADAELALITGSPHSVTALEPWAEALAAWTRDLVEAGRPFLGVCYGHQLLAHAFGGTVTRNPRGYEVGTVEVTLTEEGRRDPLLGPLAEPAGALAFHSTHNDAVVTLPSGARRLAFNAVTEVQAFALGEHAWGVQFHPEFDEAIARLYVEGREPLIRESAARLGRDPEAAVEAARASVRAVPAGRALLARFVHRAKELLR